jgi:hypothetical protein
MARAHDVERAVTSQLSEWDDHSDAHDAAEEIENGSMPPRQYKLVHPDARLSDADRAELIAALEAMEDRSGS